MESANGGVRVREELAKAKVQFLFLSSFGASLINAASGLRSWGRFCDTQNWPHFPIQIYQIILYDRIVLYECADSNQIPSTYSQGLHILVNSVRMEEWYIIQDEY